VAWGAVRERLATPDAPARQCAVRVTRAPHLRVRCAIVKRAVVAPKSRHGGRLIPLTPALAPTLRVHRPREGSDDGFVFRGHGGGPADQGSLRPGVLVPAALRAGLTGVGFHTLRQRASGGRLVSRIRPLLLALQVVLFFVLLSVVVAIGSTETGNVEKVALIAAGAVLVWPHRGTTSATSFIRGTALNGQADEALALAYFGGEPPDRRGGVTAASNPSSALLPAGDSRSLDTALPVRLRSAVCARG
jgi:hypothetical protein